MTRTDLDHQRLINVSCLLVRKIRRASLASSLLSRKLSSLRGATVAAPVSLDVRRPLPVDLAR